MSAEEKPTANNSVSKELKKKANDFLNSKKYANNLFEIIDHLEDCVNNKRPLLAVLLTLEVIFTQLLKRNEFKIDKKADKTKDESPEKLYQNWLLAQYERTLSIVLNCIDGVDKSSDATQALVTSMKLLAAEGKYPLVSTENSSFPTQRLRSILKKLASNKKSQSILIQRFKEFTEYLDIVFHSWKLVSSISSKESFQNEIFACNFLDLLNTLSVSQKVQHNQKLLCSLETPSADRLKYATTRKCINNMWNSIMNWSDGAKESVHKQILIVLIERILPHLEKPILLTDFLIDSLDCGGAVSLLALQGIFTLIQKHNITYPNIYEKLYSMFEPEIFHTKYKARLFYLADIFLSSTHLPESLVAAFMKRLARLSLIAPPQDAIIILYFIGNLILRHAGLKRLILAPSPVEVSSDPFNMEERDPTKSNAIDSSLWEIVLLQKHALPSVATAARFISQPMPKMEWDLSTVLDIKEDDIFDQEITKKAKQYGLAFERPKNLFLPKNDKVEKYWKLF